jgi:flagellar basal body-associated protein FliL
MQETFGTIILTIVTSLVTGFGGWIFGRRKNKAEAQTVELENVNKAVAIWRETAENLNAQLGMYTNELIKFRSENDTLHVELEKMKSELKSIKSENDKLKKEIEKLKAQSK